MLTLTVTTAMWSLLRALDEAERHPRLWALLLAASIGVGLLLKGLIAALFPCGARGLYLLVHRSNCSSSAPGGGSGPFAGIAGHSADRRALARAGDAAQSAVLRLHDAQRAGAYHGFFWFYFLNEHVFRFLNMRYPRDYNTVPRALFWLLHLLWLFPWSVFLPAAARLELQARGPRRPHAAAGAVLDRLHPAVLHLLDHAGVLLDALLSGAGAAHRLLDGEPDAWIRGGAKVISVIASLRRLSSYGFCSWSGTCPRRETSDAL